MVVVVSATDLTEQKAPGRRPIAPTTGYWLSEELARAYLQATLASTAVNGPISWSDRWRPEKPPSRLHSLTSTLTIPVPGVLALMNGIATDSFAGSIDISLGYNVATVFTACAPAAGLSTLSINHLGGDNLMVRPGF